MPHGKSNLVAPFDPDSSFCVIQKDSTEEKTRQSSFIVFRKNDEQTLSLSKDSEDSIQVVAQKEEKEEKEKTVPVYNRVLSFLLSFRFLMICILIAIFAAFSILLVLWTALVIVNGELLSAQLHQSTFLRMKGFVADEQKSVETVVSQAAAPFQSFELDIFNFTLVDTFIYGQIRQMVRDNNPGFSFFAGTKGDSINTISKAEDGSVSKLYIWENVTNGDLITVTYSNLENGTFNWQTLSRTPNFIAKGLWYHAALNNTDTNRAVWTPLYMIPDYPIETLWKSCMFTILDQNGLFTGYTGIDTSSISTRNILLTLSKEYAGSIAYLFEQETNYIFASSTSDPVLKIVNGAKQMQTIFEIPNSMIVQSAKFLNSETGFSSSDYSGSFLGPDGVLYYISAGRIRPNFGTIRLYAVWMTPKITYTQSTTIILLALLFISLVTCSSMFIAAIILQRAIVHSLYVLAGQVKSGNSLSWNTTGKLSVLTEVRQIQTSFDMLMRKLTLFKSFIPAHLLASIEEKDGQIETVEPQKLNSSNTYKIEELKHTKSNNSSGSISSQGSKFNMTQTNNSKDVRFKLGLQMKSITVLVISISNFASVYSPERRDTFVLMYKDLIDMLLRASKVNKGHLGVYESSHLVIGWNVLSNQVNAASLAISCASLILDGLEKQKKKWTTEGFECCLYICTRNSLVGNFGTDELKKFTFFEGELAKITKLMHTKNNKKWNKTPLIIEDSIHQICKVTHYSRPLGTISDLKRNKIICYELIVGQTKTFENDEWMYELKQKNEFNAWSLYETGFTLYKEGKFQESMKVWVELSEEVLHNDWHTKRMLNKCKKKIQAIGNSSY